MARPLYGAEILRLHALLTLFSLSRGYGYGYNSGYNYNNGYYQGYVVGPPYQVPYQQTYQAYYPTAPPPTAPPPTAPPPTAPPPTLPPPTLPPPTLPPPTASPSNGFHYYHYYQRQHPTCFNNQAQINAHNCYSRWDANGNGRCCECAKICYEYELQRYYKNMESWMKYMCLHHNLYCNSVTANTAAITSAASATIATIATLEEFIHHCNCKCKSKPPAPTAQAAPTTTTRAAVAITHSCACATVPKPACCKNAGTATTAAATTAAATTASSARPIFAQAIRNLENTLSAGFFGQPSYAVASTKVKP